MNIKDAFNSQTRKIERANDKFNETLQEIPGIGKLIKLINRASLKNQIILHGVFYFCLYHMIVAVFG